MSQYWLVVNLDKGEHLAYGGRLGEYLFDGSPRMFLPFLAIPVQPFNQDYHNASPTGDWAGDRIICVANRVADYPRRMLTDDELEELDGKEACTGHSQEEDWDPELAKNDDPSRDLFKFASITYNAVHRSYHESRFSNNHVWVLRNLSKREYVRANAGAPGCSNSGDPCVPICRFGEVVLSRICWSSNPYVGIKYDGDITRGVWAGDRFDVNIIESLEIMDGAAEWKDVSGEVAKEMFEIWKSKYKEQWKAEWRDFLD